MNGNGFANIERNEEDTGFTVTNNDGNVVEITDEAARVITVFIKANTLDEATAAV